MKIVSILTLIILSLTIVSITKSNLPNRDSWSIGIGEKVLMATWLDNEMGDTVALTRIKLKGSDTLIAERYLCGQTGGNAQSTITIKNSGGETIAESTNQNNGMMFGSRLAIREFLYSPKIKSGEVVGVYFSIKDESGKRDYTVLLGNLKLN